MFFVQGFSQYMSLPALAALMAAVACQFGSGGDQHGIDILAVEQFAKVAIAIAVFVAILLIDHGFDRIAAGRFDVADGDELDVFLFQEAAEVVGSSIADADAAQHDSLAGGDRAVEAQGRAGDDIGRHHRGGTGRQRGFQKPTPVKMRYLLRHKPLS